MDEEKKPTESWAQVFGSSNIDAVRYDQNTQQCWVRFNDGSVYRYEGVEPAIYNELLHASSKGRFVQLVLRRGYRAVKE